MMKYLCNILINKYNAISGWVIIELAFKIEVVGSNPPSVESGSS
jgi:hypothetical protein